MLKRKVKFQFSQGPFYHQNLKPIRIMKENIMRTIEGIRLGDAVQFKNLSIVPIFSNNTSTLNYISLKEGLEKALVEVTEVSEGGSVPTLKVTNNSTLPLFILDGEELVGAKQNRIVNTSMLLAGKSSFEVPVSCTESGRWKYNSEKFRDSGVVMSSKARYAKSERVYNSLKRKAGYNAQQSEVWNDIEKMHSKYATSSGTRAMKDAFIQKDNDIKKYLAAFPLLENQNGMFVFENGKLVGGEFISNSKVYPDLHEKLIKSFSIEAMHEKEEVQSNAFDLLQEATQNLNFLKDATATEYQPIGLGKDIRLEAEKAKASALEHEQDVVHLSIFPKDDVNKNRKRTSTNEPTRPIIPRLNLDSNASPNPQPQAPSRPRSRWSLVETIRRGLKI